MEAEAGRTPLAYESFGLNVRAIVVQSPAVPAYLENSPVGGTPFGLDVLLAIRRPLLQRVGSSQK